MPRSFDIAFESGERPRARVVSCCRRVPNGGPCPQSIEAIRNIRTGDPGADTARSAPPGRTSPMARDMVATRSYIPGMQPPRRLCWLKAYRMLMDAAMHQATASRSKPSDRTTALGMGFLSRGTKCRPTFKTGLSKQVRLAVATSVGRVPLTKESYGGR